MQRRSVRKFTEKQLADEDIQQILDAAIHAPNAQNAQQWHFTVVQNVQLMDKLVDVTKKNITKIGIPFLMEKIKSPEYNTFYKAPTVIFVSGPKEGKFADLDGGLASQNIMLAAESLGINSVCLASTGLIFACDEAESLEKELAFPEGYRHVCVIALGYCDGDIPACPERNQDVVSFLK